jgi:hypothetical protein
MAKKIMLLDRTPIVRLNEVGRLFKGSPKGVSEKTGKPTIGRDYNSHYLRFEPDERFKNEPSNDGFASLYDELKARWELLIQKGSVRVRLPFARLDECFIVDNAVFIRWGTGTKKAASCNGHICNLSYEVVKENGKNKYQFDRTPKPCKANADGLCPMGCSPKALLKLYIPDLYPGGCVVFPLGSPIDINSIRGTLSQFEQYGLDNVPFSLFRKSTRVNFTDDRGDQSRDNWGVCIEVDPTVASKMIASKSRQFDRLLEADFIEVEVSEPQRSIAPSASKALQAPQFPRSDDGMAFSRGILECIQNLDENALRSEVEDAIALVSSGYYDESGIGWIELEFNRALRLIQENKPKTVKQKTPQKERIDWFRGQLGTSVDEILAIIAEKNLPNSSQMDDAQAQSLISGMLALFYVTNREIPIDVFDRLSSKARESSGSDAEFLNELGLSIEAWQTENNQ